METEPFANSSRGLVDSMTVAAFLDRAAAAVPVPGGGGIAALAGAAAASMLEMTLNFTVGRKKFAAVDAEARVLLERVCALRRKLLDLVAADAAAYEKVAFAAKLPVASQAEKDARVAAVAAATRAAIEPQLEMVRTMDSLAASAADVLRVGNPNLSGDAGVAVAILPGAARAAALNVWANFGALQPPRSDEVRREVSGALSRIESACARVSREVEARLCPKPTRDNT